MAILGSLLACYAVGGGTVLLLDLLPLLTSVLTLVTACLTLFHTLKQNAVLEQHGHAINQIKSGVDGDLTKLADKVKTMQEHAEKTAIYAAQMQVYASSLKRSLLIIGKAEAAGEAVVSLRDTVSSQTVQAAIWLEPPKDSG